MKNCYSSAILFGGSAIMGLYDPWRADMVAVNGEVAGGPALSYMHSRMKESSEGRLILKERPRITTKTVDYDALAALPEGTLGRVNRHFSLYSDVIINMKYYISNSNPTIITFFLKIGSFRFQHQTQNFARF